MRYFNGISTGDELLAREKASIAYHVDPRNPDSCEAYCQNFNHQPARCPCEELWRDHLPEGSDADKSIETEET
jgi:hypothetical protein